MEQSTIDNVVTNSKYGDVLVINDGSTDITEINAKKSGAIVITMKTILVMIFHYIKE